MWLHVVICGALQPHDPSRSYSTPGPFRIFEAHRFTYALLFFFVVVLHMFIKSCD